MELQACPNGVVFVRNKHDVADRVVPAAALLGAHPSAHRELAALLSDRDARHAELAHTATVAIAGRDLGARASERHSAATDFVIGAIELALDLVQRRDA